ncbi:hypothetical protein [Allosphingosinicella humi]
MSWMPCTPDADTGEACVRLDANQQAIRLQRFKKYMGFHYLNVGARKLFSRPVYSFKNAAGFWIVELEPCTRGNETQSYMIERTEM